MKSKALLSLFTEVVLTELDCWAAMETVVLDHAYLLLIAKPKKEFKQKQAAFYVETIKHFQTIIVHQLINAEPMLF